MIAVDIDGVVCNSEPWLRKEIEERIGRTLCYNNPRTFQFDKFLKDSELNEYIIDALIKYRSEMQPHDHIRTRMALLMIEDMCGHVSFVTARPNGSVEPHTHYWLKKHFFGIKYELHSLGEFANKKKWLYDNDFNVIVDDRLKTVNAIASPYTTTYLVNREWNMGRDTADNVRRVPDLHAAVEHYFENQL